jgi:hypothetical protein
MLEALVCALPQRSLVLEIGSGSAQHVAKFSNDAGFGLPYDPPGTCDCVCAIHPQIIGKVARTRSDL